jgi:hypothetical protein
MAALADDWAAQRQLCIASRRGPMKANVAIQQKMPVGSVPDEKDRPAGESSRVPDDAWPGQTDVSWCGCWARDA